MVYAHNSASHPVVLLFGHPVRMGIFFMVSGYLINTRLRLTDRSRTIARNFLFFVLLSLVWRLGYGVVSHEPLMLTDWGGALLAGEDFGLNIPMWFLIAYVQILFMCTVIRSIKPPSARWTVTVVLMMAGIVLMSHGINPLYLSQAMIYLPFFEIGAYIHKLRGGKEAPGIKYPFAIILLGAALIWGRANMPEIPFVARYILDSVLAIVLGMWLYLTLTVLQGRTAILTFYGRHSITVLCMHILILDVVWRLCYAVTGAPGRIEAFVMTIAVAVLLVPCCIGYDKFVAPRMKG